MYTYKLPFAAPFRTAVNGFKYREGLYISLQKEGITALGEAAPLPRFSNENLSTVVDEMKGNFEIIMEHFSTSFSLDETLQLLRQQQFSPSLEFGLYSLAASYLAQKHRSSLHHLLFNAPSSRVQLNAVIGMESIENLNKINQYIDSGFKTIKIKAGSNLQVLMRAIEEIRSHRKSIQIRIDANQSWTLEQALSYLKRLESYHIEYCEEPLTQPNAESIRHINNATTVPIALDESLLKTFRLEQALNLASVLIIKPMVLGIPSFSQTLSSLACRNTNKLIFTTTLESGIGRMMTATLAAGFGSADSAHGLATGQLLKKDIWHDDMFIRNGYFTLPKTDQVSSLMNTKLKSLSVQEVISHD